MTMDGTDHHPGAGSPLVREIWIQLEGRDDHVWNMVPGVIDRMHGKAVVRSVERPLIFRRYRPPKADGSGAWKEPDDRKVNPWDLNELNPRFSGGSIPGPTLECAVGAEGIGEELLIHFRNDDQRTLPLAYRVHSMHAHGVLFGPTHDGAFPLSPPARHAHGDPDNRITDDEAHAWHLVGVHGPMKQGDRVPPGATFTYRWRTEGRRETAGVWLYHDHSIRDVDNVRMGAIGFLVVHDTDDPDDVFLDIDRDPHALEHLPDGSPTGDPAFLDEEAGVLRLRTPPTIAQYLQLYHEVASPVVRSGKVTLEARGMAINGRQFLGSAPTLVAGATTRMRFGVAAMNADTFHTFHIHGHRWARSGAASGPGAINPYEDTRILGPAESFAFTILEGGPLGPPRHEVLGEWHMHCHVLHHMMPGGMMGSLLVAPDNHPRLDDLLLVGFGHGGGGGHGGHH